jgi:hypothetical protein
LPTITGKYGLPHHPPDFREALSPFFFFFPWAFVHLINYVGIVFMNVIFLNFNDNYGVSLINIEYKGHSFQTILKIRIPFKTIIYNVK